MNRCVLWLCALAGFIGASLSASGQLCDSVHIILVAENQNNVSFFDRAAMNESGEVVITVSELADDPLEDDSITRVLGWNLAAPSDPTQNVLVEGGDRQLTPYSFVAGAKINAQGDVIFVGNVVGDGRNIFDLAGNALIDFVPGPSTVGQTVLFDNDESLRFAYLQLNVAGGVEYCINRNDPELEVCGAAGEQFVLPAGTSDGNIVYFLRINGDGSRQIVNADDLENPICTVQSGGMLSGPSVNDAGNVAFYASQACDGSGAAGEGIYLYDAAAEEASLVVDYAHPSIGLSSPEQVRAPLLNEADRIAFVAVKDGAHSIYIYNGENLGRPLKLNDGMDPSKNRRLYGYIVDPDDATGETDRLLYEGLFQGKDTLVLTSACDVQLAFECTGDLNGDGVVNGGDLLVLLSSWGPCLACAADLNGDGVVDGSDLLMLLGNWGVCPDPPGCGDADAGSCCQSNGTPSCNSAPCCEWICDIEDSYCCDVMWDSLCAELANELCVTCGADVGCGEERAGSCCEANGTPSCDDETCCEQVCLENPFCCIVEWDSLCADAANDECDVCQPETCPLVWDPTIGQPGLQDGGLLAMTAFDGALVVGGWFTSAGEHDDAQGFAWWDGSQWHLPTWINGLVSPVLGGNDFFIETTVLRSFGPPSGKDVTLAFAMSAFLLDALGEDTLTFIGLLSELDDEPEVIGFADDDVADMEVFFDAPGNGAALYASGRFTEIDGVEAINIARFDGDWSQPFSVDFGIPDPIVSTMPNLLRHEVDGEEALFFSHFTIAASGEHNVIGMWDGSEVTVIGYVQGQVWELEVFDGELHIGGDFSEVFDSMPGAAAGGESGVQANNVARWDGNAWSALEEGLDIRVFTLGVFDDGSGEALYAGGTFIGSDEDPVRLVRRWDGQSWSTLNDTGPFNSGSAPRVSVMEVFDDGLGPGLYIGGSFTSILVDGDEPDEAASGLDEVEVGQIAAWRCAEHPPTEGCGDPGTGDCCVSQTDSPFCENAECCECICACDPFCCDTNWDSLCAGMGTGGCGASNPNGLCVSECSECLIEPECGSDIAGDCCEENSTPYCDDETCCDAVCALDSFCCDEEWDDICVTLAEIHCGDLCDDNGSPE